MPFGPGQYIPVLKLKRGEKAALRALPDEMCARVTPLLEVVERKEKDPTLHLNSAFSGLSRSVGRYAGCFLDLRELAPDGPQAAATAFQQAEEAGVVFTPVTGMSRNVDVEAALKYRANGTAVRLTRAECRAGNLAQILFGFLQTHSLDPEEVDLLVDLGDVDTMVSEGVAALASECLAAVPNQEGWRTLTLTSCGFPRSMGGVGKHSFDVVERSDWLSWRDHLYAKRGEIPRLPSYSDCAIQHRAGVEGFDPRYMQVSASIRYTLGEAWLLIKGESTKSVPPGGQFPQLGARLVAGDLNKYFAGFDHCGGCGEMVLAVAGAPKYGSAEVWRRLGTIHHLATVARALEALAWP